MIALAGLSACVTEPTDALEDSAVPPSSLTESAAQLTSEEERNAIAVPLLEVARVRMFYGELVYYAPSLDEVSDDPDAPPATLQEIDTLEIARPDSAGSLRALARDMSPLEEYLTTTAPSVPVPRLLLASESSQAIRDLALRRTIVERLSGPVAGLPEAQLAGDTAAMGNVTEWCTGTTSASFKADVCSRNNWDVNFCHNGTWYSVTDSVGSSHKERVSRSRTLACGANGRVRHYYKSGGIWYKPIDEAIPSNQLWRWTRHGGAALQRAITHSRTASGFVRGASHFNVPF